MGEVEKIQKEYLKEIKELLRIDEEKRKNELEKINQYGIFELGTLLEETKMNLFSAFQLNEETIQLQDEIKAFELTITKRKASIEKYDNFTKRLKEDSHGIILTSFFIPLVMSNIFYDEMLLSLFYAFLISFTANCSIIVLKKFCSSLKKSATNKIKLCNDIKEMYEIAVDGLKQMEDSIKNEILVQIQKINELSPLISNENGMPNVNELNTNINKNSENEINYDRIIIDKYITDLTNEKEKERIKVRKRVKRNVGKFK